MSTSQRAAMLCGWGVKAGMVRVWVAGKAVIPLLTRAMSERFRDEFMIKRYTNRRYFACFTLPVSVQSLERSSVPMCALGGGFLE